MSLSSLSHPYLSDLAFRRIVEGEWSEQDIKDPIDDMITLLTEKKDRALTQKWGIWLTKQDPERGLKVCIVANTGYDDVLNRSIASHFKG